MANSKKKSTKPKSPTLKNQIKSLNDELKDEKDKFLILDLLTWMHQNKVD